MNAPKGDSPRAQRAFFIIVCALIVVTFAWIAQPGFLELANPQAKDSYYNLLVQGFRGGQLNVKRDAPPGLAKLSNPYDPSLNEAYIWDDHHLSYEMSYYGGKLYLYFGVAPTLVLFWPIAALTGHYLLQKNAIVIFFAGGFLLAACLLHAIRQRYFPEIKIAVAIVGLLALGLATGILETLASCDVYEVAKSCGFAFTMLALAGIWRALNQPKQQITWLLLASLAYGLAIGSRPSLLFGAIILLMPVVRQWFTTDAPDSRQRAAWLFAAATAPITLIIFGLMIYNDRRFGNPFEFGWHYQLTSFDNHTARQFSLHYLWFNFRFYFLEPMFWDSHFPFLKSEISAPSNSGYFGIASPYSGVLVNYPVVWLALAAPLAWRLRPMEPFSPLRWFIVALVLLFATCAVTVCLFFAAGSTYELDFLPALMLLAMIGIFCLERALANAPAWRRAARIAWCGLLAYSLAFNALAAVESFVAADYFTGNSFLHQNRLKEAIERFQAGLTLEPDDASLHVGLGTADYKIGKTGGAVAELNHASELDPQSAEAHYDLGCALLPMGRVYEATQHFEKALVLDPHFAETHFPEENNNLAWSFATNPDPAKRNGPLAVKLAEGACRMTHYQTTIMVGTLAAAYAEAGRFDEAIATAKKACALASQSGDQKLLKNNQKLLALYFQHQPFHESPAQSPK